MRDLQQIVDHCKNCQKGHAVVEFLEEFLATTPGNARALDVTDDSLGARITITVELRLDADGKLHIVGPMYATTWRGGVISRDALLDLGFGADVLSDMVKTGRLA